MNEYTIENSMIAIAVSAPFCTLVFFLGSWMLTANENITARELAKHETCYQEYRMDERTGETYLVVDYCGK